MAAGNYFFSAATVFVLRMCGPKAGLAAAAAAVAGTIVKPAAFAKATLAAAAFFKAW